MTHPKISFLRVVLLFCVLCDMAQAFESFSEFQSLHEGKEAGFDQQIHLYPEYAADLLSYSRFPEQELRFLSHPKALSVGFGSLSTTRFAMEHRLKIHSEISKYLEFRFTYFDESSLEEQNRHHLLEFVVWPLAQVGISFYGEPAFRKPNDDTGIALILRPKAGQEIRIFNTFVDVTRLKYPDGSNTFLEPDLPYSRGLVARFWEEGLEKNEKSYFLEAALRYETPTRWRFMDQNYTYFYAKKIFQMNSYFERSGLWSVAFRMQWDQTHESRTAATLPSASAWVPMGPWETHRWTTLSEFTWHRWGPAQKSELTLGLESFERKWVSERGEGSYRDLLPYARVRIPVWGAEPRKDHWIVGYILTWHQEEGSALLGINPSQSHKTENRLNLSYEFSFGTQGSLKLLGSVDLDEFGTQRSWDGGGAQMEFYF